MKVAGLFAGVGGLELGFRRAGHDSELLCEIDAGARAVLRRRFDAPAHDDIRTLRDLPERVDLVAAGFPCQDLSQAGKTAGIAGSRSGLVGEVFRLIRRHRTKWVLLENVPFMLQLSRGRAMEVVVEAMEALGYRWAYRVVNSRAFGVPQRRARILFLASREGDPRDVLFADAEDEPIDEIDAVGERACGFYWTEGTRGLGWAVDCVPTLKGGSGLGIPSPPAIVLRSGRVVTPNICDAERMQGFEANWTLPSNEVAKPSHRWKLVGNAVTVDVAQWVGRRLRRPAKRGRDVEGVPLHREGAWPRAAWNVGDGRFEAHISSYPVRVSCQPLEKWLQHEMVPLSEKATNGFLLRAQNASLRFPPRFLRTLHDHLSDVRRHSTASVAALQSGA